MGDIGILIGRVASEGEVGLFGGAEHDILAVERLVFFQILVFVSGVARFVGDFASEVVGLSVATDLD